MKNQLLLEVIGLTKNPDGTEIRTGKNNPLTGQVSRFKSLVFRPFSPEAKQLSANHFDPRKSRFNIFSDDPMFEMLSNEAIMKSKEAGNPFIISGRLETVKTVPRPLKNQNGEVIRDSEGKVRTSDKMTIIVFEGESRESAVARYGATLALTGHHTEVSELPDEKEKVDEMSKEVPATSK